MPNQIALLKSGKYEFLISNVSSFDRDGNQLKTKDGMAYRKLRLSVIDNEGYVKYIYDPVFNSKKVQQVLRCVGRTGHPELEMLDDLVGTGGTCTIVVRKGKEGYDDQNAVDVYIQKETVAIELRKVNHSEVKGLEEYSDNLEPEDEEVPF